MGFEVEHLRRCVVSVLLRMGRVLSEMADLTLALYAPQWLSQDTGLFLSEPFHSAELLLATESAGSVAEHRRFALSISNVAVVVCLHT